MNVQLPNKIAVACPTEEEARTFMQTLAAYTNVRWRSGTNLSSRWLNWAYRESTVYTIEHLHLSYGSGEHPKECHIPVISLAEFLSYFGLTYLSEEDDAVDLSGLL